MFWTPNPGEPGDARDGQWGRIGLRLFFGAAAAAALGWLLHWTF